jgi:hypothetical protein
LRLSPQDEIAFAQDREKCTLGAPFSFALMFDAIGCPILSGFPPFDHTPTVHMQKHFVQNSELALQRHDFPIPKHASPVNALCVIHSNTFLKNSSGVQQVSYARVLLNLLCIIGGTANLFCGGKLKQSCSDKFVLILFR